MNYLLDTCTISDFFKKSPSVIDHFKKLTPKQIHISAITAMEIEFGLLLNLDRAKKIRPFWERLTQQIQILPFTTTCALSVASIRSQLQPKGLLIGPYDLLIAGTAVVNEMILVTSNLKEFKRVPSLVIENWRDTHS